MSNKRKGKRMMGWIIAGIIVAALSVGGAIGFSKLGKEHNEMKSLPLNAVDFGNLKDGEYIGEYDGGMYQWRTNKIKVTVASGKVEKIEVLEHKENQAADFLNTLYGRVIDEQSLKVDAISGATLTSKAYLQGVENALLKAKK